jgi:hypothetical protein
MPDPLMYSADHYVVLEPGQSEQFLTGSQMLTKLEQLVVQYPEALPPDVGRAGTVTAQAQILLDTTCELEVESGRSIQWYVVRLEK